VMFRRRKYGIAEAVSDYPVSMFCFELLYADGTDLTRLPYLERRAALAEAITTAPRLRLTTAEQVDDEAEMERVFEQAVAEGCEGVICKSLNPTAQLPGRGTRLAVDQAQARLPHRTVGHPRPGGGGRAGRAGPPRRDVRRAAAGRLRRCRVKHLG
jgi:hypothetical protein